MTANARQTVGGNLHRSSRGRWHQGCVLVAAAVAVLAALVLPPLSLEQQFWIILVPVAVFGLSHGGADPLILKRLTGNRPGTMPYALTAYSAAVLGFVGLIWFFPVLALFVFLMLSIWHFGFTDTAYLSSSRNSLLIWVSGSLTVLGPMIGHPEQTSELFAWLVNRETETVLAVVTIAGPVLASLWLVAFGTLVWRHNDHLAARVFTELVLVAAAMILLPPLLAFTFYFCIVHSIRHFLSIAEYRLGEAEFRQVVRFLLRKSAPATLGAIAIALVAWGALVVWSPASSLLVEGVRVMFWGLAALTVPHGFVVKMWWDRPVNAPGG
ncbi:MAG: Brp/Blh family beta-carotene 15,15'-dioxygenase [Marinobacter sp.]|uniref:Brp/Blh family beta-carotene 15,15'-dioxygenase n=1 Tax=Marinobacter sp. TaxID=50741 RepID=UPI003567FA3E